MIYKKIRAGSCNAWEPARDTACDTEILRLPRCDYGRTLLDIVFRHNAFALEVLLESLLNMSKEWEFLVGHWLKVIKQREQVWRYYVAT